MAAIEAALARLRAQAAVKGPEWLTRQVQELLGDSDEARGGGGTVPRARRSRPPARFSPGPAPRPPRDRRSPGRDGSVPPAKKRQQECRGSGRSTRRRPAPGSGATGSTCAGSPSHSPATSRVGVLGGGPSTSGVRVEEVPGAEDGRSVARKLETGRKGRRPADGQAGRRGGQVEEQGGTGGHHRSGPHRRSGSAHPGETHLSSRRSVAASGGGSPRGLPSQAEADVAERSEGELSTEDEVADPAVESGSAAVGAVPGRPDGGAPRLVWIVGHSYVCWGARRGDMRPDGRQLGISRRAAELHWLGIPGMQWDGVMGVVDRYVLLDGPPDVLVLHAGGNDLGLRKVRDLLVDIKADFLRLRERFPNTILLWSDIVARTRWRWARSVASIQKTRIRVNKVVGRFVVKNGGLVIRHRELESNVGLYLRRDGVHLTDVGIDLWSLGLQGGIQTALRVWGCPQG
ncbi:uncharacterized protein LOC143974648 [Lithobates pipiens]